MVEIIAEAGVNHFGSLSMALRMANAAATADADVVKFQTYTPDAILHRNDPNFKLLEGLALPRRDFVKLARHCEELEIEFMSTPGDPDSLRFLAEEVGVKRIKIGSDDLTYTNLLIAAQYSGLPIILSTGMATLREIEYAVRLLGYAKLTLLHCVSLYPCFPAQVNLRAIETLRQHFGRHVDQWGKQLMKIGYSDHTNGAKACLGAVVMGAEVIEKHFMLSHPPGCVDQAVSITEDELHQLVADLRIMELMVGDGVKAPCLDELGSLKSLRKGKDGRRPVAA